MIQLPEFSVTKLIFKVSKLEELNVISGCFLYFYWYLRQRDSDVTDRNGSLRAFAHDDIFSRLRAFSRSACKEVLHRIIKMKRASPDVCMGLYNRGFCLC